jgi:hypothetical protein
MPTRVFIQHVSNIELHATRFHAPLWYITNFPGGSSGHNLYRSSHRAGNYSALSRSAELLKVAGVALAKASSLPKDDNLAIIALRELGQKFVQNKALPPVGSASVFVADWLGFEPAAPVVAFNLPVGGLDGGATVVAGATKAVNNPVLTGHHHFSARSHAAPS